jgi:uncharacterized membrane protein YoaK (UPF0700 family)
LSYVAGFVDTAGFVALFGLFTAHVTGDLVAAGVAMGGRPTLAMLGRLAMIPTFMVSVAAAALFVRKQKQRGTAPLPSLLALMTGALAIFCATGIALHPLAQAPEVGAVVLIGGTGVFAMAIQNTLMRDVLTTCSPTTIMTGNLTQVTIDLVELLFPAQNDTHTRDLVRMQVKARLSTFGLPLLSFMAGASSGALLTRTFGLASIAVPTLAVGAFTVIVWRATRKTARLRLSAPPPVRAALDAEFAPLDPEATEARARSLSGTRLIAARPQADVPRPAQGRRTTRRSSASR